MELKKTIITKIAALVLLLFTGWNLYKSFSYQNSILLLALLTIILTSNNHLSSCLNFLKKSSKNYKKFLLTLILDVLFFSLSYFLLNFALKFFQNITLTKLGKGPEGIDPSIISSYLININILALSTIIVFFLIYTISRTLIWKLLTNKKINMKSFLEFAKYNLVWWIFWIIPAVIVLFGVRIELKNLGLIFFLTIYSHFSGTLHYGISQEKKIMNTFARLSLEKFQYLLTPYALFFVIYTALTQITRIMPVEYASITNVIFFLITISWLRVYLKEAFENT
ncbi:hypothetical protein HZA97_00585 [Candidatus Woesearchaeota archaeon]|nr:hypothetical protein [Candidatus Woesearchaeota archaeon]